MRVRIAIATVAAAVLGVAAWWIMGDRPQRPALAPAAIRDETATSSDENQLAGVVETDRDPQRDAVDALPAGAPEERVAPTHRIVGRVVDGRRWPVEGAQVTFADTESTESRDGGRFELTIVRSEGELGDCGVVARDGRGRCACRAVHLTPGDGTDPLEVDLGTLVLDECFALRVSEAGAPAPGALVRVDLGHARQPAGEHRVDASGELELEALPRRPVYLTATLPGRRGHARAFVPEESAVAVALESLGSAEVIVVDARTGKGVADAVVAVTDTVSVPARLPGQERWFYAHAEAPKGARSAFVPTGLPGEQRSFRVLGEFGLALGVTRAHTDAHGRASIEGLFPGARTEVRVEAAGYASFPPPRSGGAPVEAGGPPVQIELEPLDVRTLRWPIVAGEVPPPTDGTTIRFRHYPGSYRPGQEPPPPADGRMQGTTLVVDQVLGSANFIAAAPDGALAVLWCDPRADLGPETSFHKSRRIDVLVRDGQGDPVAGAQAIARDQGNREMCGWVSAGADGVALLEGLTVGKLDVYVRGPGAGDHGTRAGSVDLDGGDARLEVTVPATVRARLTLLVDGAPGLPGQFELRARPRNFEFRAPRGARVVGEDPARGELLLELEHSGQERSVEVEVSAVGFSTASVTFELPPDGREASARLALERATVLVAQVMRPEEGRVGILPQRFDPELGTWRAAPELGVDRGLSEPNGPGGAFIFGGLTPGRWRVIDERSGAGSEALAVVEGDREVQVLLDLSTVEWVSGRIELDDPKELLNARVRVIDPMAPMADRWAGWRPGSIPPEGASTRDGSFRVKVPGDREVTVVAWHPWLSPDPERGAVTLRGGRGGRDGLVLRLTAADELRLALPGLRPGVRAIRIARYSGEPKATPLEWHYAPVADGVARCAMPRGTWTLWVDPKAGFRPFVLRDVSIEGVTEQPPVQLEAGSSVRVRIRVPEGQSFPRIAVFASRLDLPEYGRDLNSGGEEVAVLPGIGPGRFRLRFAPIMGGVEWSERELVLDGTCDVDLELDLR